MRRPGRYPFRTGSSPTPTGDVSALTRAGPAAAAPRAEAPPPCEGASGVPEGGSGLAPPVLRPGERAASADGLSSVTSDAHSRSARSGFGASTNSTRSPSGGSWCAPSISETLRKRREPATARKASSGSICPATADARSAMRPAIRRSSCTLSTSPPRSSQMATMQRSPTSMRTASPERRFGFIDGATAHCHSSEWLSSSSRGGSESSSTE
mmetsp:Transcript_8850/g.28135  ORF Transcript_8850/g.28135 Transcript_8850/m.28135 type:complete len:211 (-) Transcript_8850:127-759(-)